MIALLLALSASVLALSASALAGGATDRFASVAELQQHYVEGRDYEIISQHRSSDVLVAAIHGGSIEYLTDELASQIAGQQHSLYLFKSLLPEGPAWDHHVTSEHFREPRLETALARAETCVSLHGYSYLHRRDRKEPPSLLLGGLNADLRDEIAKELAALQKKVPALRVLLAGTKFAARSKLNFVNRVPQEGVQIELSANLRDLLKGNSELRSTFTAGVQQAIRTWQSRYGCGAALQQTL